MNNKSMILLLVLVLIVFLVFGILFIVKESECGVLLKFGEVVWEDFKFGLYFKMLLIYEFRVFDGCICVMEMCQEEYLIQEKKCLIVDFYVMW